MKPGLLPVSNTDVPPRAHASSTRPRRSSPSGRPSSKNCAAGRDDVRSRLEERDHVVEVDRARHVEHAVRAERVDRRAIRGRLHADRLLAAQRSRVDAFLRRVVDEQADEIERRVPDHLAQRAGADVAGRPLDDAVAGGGAAVHAAGSANVLSSRNSASPATPISRPMPACL